MLCVYFYPDSDYAETLDLCRSTSPYGLTGAVFANDRLATEQAYDALRHAAGNFYINDKPTGAVIGQQPFGGGRASGTNDKTGLGSHLLRWTNIRTVKENFAPAKDYRLPVPERVIESPGAPAAEEHRPQHPLRGHPVAAVLRDRSDLKTAGFGERGSIRPCPGQRGFGR